MTADLPSSSPPDTGGHPQPPCPPRPGTLSASQRPCPDVPLEKEIGAPALQPGRRMTPQPQRTTDAGQRRFPRADPSSVDPPQEKPLLMMPTPHPAAQPARSHAGRTDIESLVSDVTCPSRLMPPHETVSDNTIRLAGFLTGAIPEIEAAAQRLAPKDAARVTALADTKEASYRLRVGPGNGYHSALRYSQSLAYITDRLLDHQRKLPQVPPEHRRADEAPTTLPQRERNAALEELRERTRRTPQSVRARPTRSAPRGSGVQPGPDQTRPHPMKLRPVSLIGYGPCGPASPGPQPAQRLRPRSRRPCSVDAEDNREKECGAPRPVLEYEAGEEGGAARGCRPSAAAPGSPTPSPVVGREEKSAPMPPPHDPLNRGLSRIPREAAAAPAGKGPYE